MFEVKDGGYTWNGKHYEKFRDVMRAMGDDICEGNASVEFGDLTGLQLQGKALSQFLLFYAVAQLDVPALIQSVNADQYRKWTRMQGPVWIRRNNPLFARNFTIPMGYESNRTMHCAIWPALDSVYNRDTGFILTKKGKFRYETVLSFICDVTLFSGNDSPFKKALDVFVMLGNDKRTSDLDKHAMHEDFTKLKILAAQLDVGDITVPDDAFISIGDVRASRYACKAKDEIYGDSSYVNDMLALPPSMQGGGFYTWLSSAAEARGKRINLEDSKTVSPKEETTAPSAFVPNFVGADDNDIMPKPVHTEPERPISDDFLRGPDNNTPAYVPGKTQYDKFAGVLEQIRKEQVFHKTCVYYCMKSGTSFDDVKNALSAMGLSAEEDIYRAIPVYLRRQGVPVNVKMLAEYCKELAVCYGDCTLRLDA